MKLVEALVKGNHIKADAHAKYLQECEIAAGKIYLAFLTIDLLRLGQKKSSKEIAVSKKYSISCAVHCFEQSIQIWSALTD